MNMNFKESMGNNPQARILIVDDETKNIQVLGAILKKQKYQIYVAQNGLQALETAEEVLPDLILLDILMPQMDGFEACEQLKASPETKHIPVIFLTARADTGDIVKGFALGAEDYVTKPFNSSELLARVRTHLELKFSRDQIKKVSSERKELLHILCHDLSTPFTSINSLLELMEDDYSVFEDEKDSFLSAAFSVVKNGINVIALVRKMSSLEEYHLELEMFPLADAVTESFYMLESRFSEKRIEPKIHIESNLDIQAEKTSFVNSVMNNIFSNAIKFSYPDSKVIVRAVKTGDHIELSVRDFGIGMDKRLLNDLFNISKTTSRTGTGGESGTGFGMPLIKKFVTAYGGTIEVFSKEEKESPRDHGTEIKLRLKTGSSVQSRG